MRIAVLGGGPGGLYAALLLKKANPAHEITVWERNPPDATYGWGVVFSEQTLGELEEADPESHREITSRFVYWTDIDVIYRDTVLRSGGHAFSGIARKTLLQILQRHCRRQGVELVFLHEIGGLDGYRDFDLVIAADGVNSFVRGALPHAFRPTLTEGRARFVWYGADRTFEAFTFAFRQSEHGLFQAHAYPFDERRSTFIVECTEETWRRAGLETADEAESIRYCSELFAPELRYRPLLSNRSMWISFPTVRCRRWHLGNLVLLGDAAHTAHFSIGSGTRMAMEDAISLARAVEEHADLEEALTRYELDRRPAVERLQALAEESSAYFENVSRYSHFEPHQFAFSLLSRSGRITYENLRQRDPHFVQQVSRWFVRSADGRTPEHVPPRLAPIRLRQLRLVNRMATQLPGDDRAADGLPGDWELVQLGAAAMQGAGLVLTEMAAVSPHGRVTPGSLGLYAPEHVAAWRRVVDFVHVSSPARVGLVLGHAGRRGACRPRWEGLDRPLREDGWPLLSASAIAYGHSSRVPQQLDAEGMALLRQAFADAAARAQEAGFDLLELHLGHGYLLGSFLSPLSNRRRDAFGGSLKKRMRFPLQVVEAVRTRWPAERPLAVALQVSDWGRGGLEVEGAVEMARALGERGCDLIHVVAGQTVPAEPVEDRSASLIALSDWIRTGARTPTMVGGHFASADAVDTVLAAGRTDLCLVAGVAHLR